MLLELPQHRLRRADDALPATGAQEFQILFAHHAAVHHPHAIQRAVLFLHGCDDRLHRCRIVPLAGEDFVAQRKAVLRHHQSDADLRSIAATVAAVATLRHWTARHLALEVRAGDIVLP
jgi:hypothetical protein